MIEVKVIIIVLGLFCWGAILQTLIIAQWFFMTDHHQSVMCAKLIHALVTDPHGYYVDVTFGRGGHTQALLNVLAPDAQVLALDQDLSAIDYARSHFANESRLKVVHGSFMYLQSVLEAHHMVGRVSGIMADLGVSSPQLDQAERGFSFMRDGPLDMRMDCSQGVSASEWINSASAQVIADVLYRFGEERYSRRIATAIVKARDQMPIFGTVQLADIIRDAHPRWPKHHHPATRSFQAIRIFINQELDALQALLPQIKQSLCVGGRMAILSFHSLEDRMIKHFVKHDQADPFPDYLPLTEEQRLNAQGDHLRFVTKVMVADKEEIQHNPRARSAKMRVAEKVGQISLRNRKR